MRDSDFDADGRTLPFFLPEGVTDLSWDLGLVADTIVEPTSLRPVDEPTLLGYRVLLPLIREK